LLALPFIVRVDSWIHQLILKLFIFFIFYLFEKYWNRGKTMLNIVRPSHTALFRILSRVNVSTDDVLMDERTSVGNIVDVFCTDINPRTLINNNNNNNNVCF